MATTIAIEGGVHLTALPSPGPKARFLPAPLIRARAEVMNPRNCLDLNRIARQALYGVLAFFDIRRPAEPVFASRENICAEALLGSQPTLYRALADLVAKGYISREQGRRLGQATYGQYSVSRIWLTEKALHMLGLVGQSKPKQDADQGQKPARKEAADGGHEGSFPQVPSINMSDRLQENELSPSPQLSLKEQPSHKSQPTVKGRAGESLEKGIDNKTGLPTELVRLMPLGLSKTRICALMRQAREHGNGGKLGAVVTLVWERLQQLGNSHAVFAYLSKLVRQRKDYARLVAIQGQYEEKGRVPKEVAERLAAKLPVFLERAHGMLLVTRAGKQLGVLQRLGEGGYVEVIDDQGTRRSMPVNARMVSAWEEGDLVLRNPAQCAETCEDWA